MVILKSLKKQLNQFVSPDIEAIDEEKISYVAGTHTSPKNGPFQKGSESTYSHGLEDIYALKNIDPKTIRKLGGSSEHPQNSEGEPKKCAVSKKKYSLPSKLQGELKLGEEHSSYIPSFALSLPIHVLDVSDIALKTIQFHGIQFIHDVIDDNWEELLHTKKIGQGHIEELKEALENYTKGKELYRCQTIDFEALIQGIIPTAERAKHHANLEQYQLEHLVPLNALMKVEAKRASNETKMRWIDESQSMLHSVDCVEMIHSSIRRVVMAFVVPWLRRREGFAYEYEIEDLLEQISENSALFVNATNFLSKCYFDDKPIFSSCLPCKEGKLYFANQNEKERFEEIENKTLSYFYHSDNKYSLQELSLWVCRELARSWLDHSVDYIKKVIAYSSLFTVFKKEHCTQLVVLK